MGIAYAAPAPKADAAFVAPFVPAPAVVTATSSQVIARNYNGIAAAPLVAAPAVAPVAAPVVAAPYAAYPAYSAYSAYSPYSPYVTYF